MPVGSGISCPQLSQEPLRSIFMNNLEFHHKTARVSLSFLSLPGSRKKNIAVRVFKNLLKCDLEKIVPQGHNRLRIHCVVLRLKLNTFKTKFRLFSFYLTPS